MQCIKPELCGSRIKCIVPQSLVHSSVCIKRKVVANIEAELCPKCRTEIEFVRILECVIVSFDKIEESLFGESCAGERSIRVSLLCVQQSCLLREFLLKFFYYPSVSARKL